MKIYRAILQISPTQFKINEEIISNFGYHKKQGISSKKSKLDYPDQFVMHT